MSLAKHMFMKISMLLKREPRFQGSGLSTIDHSSIFYSKFGKVCLGAFWEHFDRVGLPCWDHVASCIWYSENLVGIGGPLSARTM